MGAATRRACGPWGRRLCLLSCGHPGPSGHPSLPRFCSPRRSRCRQAVLSYSPVRDRSPAARLQSWEPQTCSFSSDLPLALFQSRTWFHSGPLYHRTLTHRTFPTRDPVLQHPLGPLSTPTALLWSDLSLLQPGTLSPRAPPSWDPASQGLSSPRVQDPSRLLPLASPTRPPVLGSQCAPATLGRQWSWSSSPTSAPFSTPPATRTLSLGAAPTSDLCLLCLPHGSFTWCSRVSGFSWARSKSQSSSG